LQQEVASRGKRNPLERGETRQWLAPSPEFRNTYEKYIGPSRFVNWVKFA
jgi:hypothetical protein